VAQGKGSEFKPQYHKKQNKQANKNIRESKLNKYVGNKEGSFAI
jgi:hypothetical protein